MLPPLLIGVKIGIAVSSPKRLPISAGILAPLREIFSGCQQTPRPPVRSPYLILDASTSKPTTIIVPFLPLCPSRTQRCPGSEGSMQVNRWRRYDLLNTSLFPAPFKSCALARGVSEVIPGTTKPGSQERETPWFLKAFLSRLQLSMLDAPPLYTPAEQKLGSLQSLPFSRIRSLPSTFGFASAIEYMKFY